MVYGRSMGEESKRMPVVTLLAGLVLLTLPACSTLTSRKPDLGRALIDVTPNQSESDRIDVIRLVAVNGTKARGTQTMLEPGLNRVRVGFQWPQGGRQEADLCFHAIAGTVYTIYFASHPPYVNRLKQRNRADEALGKMADCLAEAEGEGAGYALLLAIPIGATLVSASAVTRVGKEMHEQQKAVTWVDLSVVAQEDNLQGVVRRVRVYPDGRVDAKPWDAHAQMAPRGR